MRIYIITGEESGDLHAANLVYKMNKQIPDLDIRAWGGEHLRKITNVKIVKHIRKTSFMGIWHVIKNIFSIKKNL